MFFICHSQFYWQRNWSSESSHTFPKSHSYSGRAGIWIKVYLIPVTILIIITLTKAKYWKLLMTWGFPGGSDSKESACNAGDLSFNPWVRKREWQPTLVFLPGKFHEQRSLVSYSPWDHKKSDTIEWLTHTHTHTHTHTNYLKIRRTVKQMVWQYILWSLGRLFETGPGWAKFWWISRRLWEGQRWWGTCLI